MEVVNFWIYARESRLNDYSFMPIYFFSKEYLLPIGSLVKILLDLSRF
jgi:hypothetical protein